MGEVCGVVLAGASATGEASPLPSGTRGSARLAVPGEVFDLVPAAGLGGGRSAGSEDCREPVANGDVLVCSAAAAATGGLSWPLPGGRGSARPAVPGEVFDLVPGVGLGGGRSAGSEDCRGPVANRTVSARGGTSSAGSAWITAGAPSASVSQGSLPERMASGLETECDGPCSASATKLSPGMVLVSNNAP